MHSWTSPYQGPTPGAEWTPPEVQWGLKIFSKYSWEQCQQVLWKEFCSKMHSWTSSHWGLTLGAGWTPPRCPGGSEKISERYLYHFQQVLKKEFYSRMDSWTCSHLGHSWSPSWRLPPGLWPWCWWCRWWTWSGSRFQKLRSRWIHTYPIIPYRGLMWPPWSFKNGHIHS